VVGDREVETRTLSVRNRQGQDLGTLSLDEVIVRLGEEVAQKIH
jgi:threonyl-tRNA synthetase